MHRRTRRYPDPAQRKRKHGSDALVRSDATPSSEYPTLGVRLRTMHDGILVGVNTVKNDDPQLNSPCGFSDELSLLHYHV